MRGYALLEASAVVDESPVNSSGGGGNARPRQAPGQQNFYKEQACRPAEVNDGGLG